MHVDLPSDWAAAASTCAQRDGEGQPSVAFTLASHQDSRQNFELAQLRTVARASWENNSKTARPEVAAAAWCALLAGRWSLLESFDSDGQRFWVAVENDPPSIVQRRLSELELSVVGHIVAGHAQKLIACELGLSQGTVSKLVARACRRLGVKHRAELMALHAALAEHP